MLPFIFDWHWTIGRIVFMGLFYAALGAVSLAVGFSVFKTIIDMMNPDNSDQH